MIAEKEDGFERMEKNAVLGEILYIGLIFEKGRCKSSGIWRHSYVQSLRKHIQLLKEVAECIEKPFQITEDNILLKKVYCEISADTILKEHYPFSKAADVRGENIITECGDKNKYIEIIRFMNKLLEDILLELNMGVRKDKEKISRLIFSAHNLPRVYLSIDANSLCSLRKEGISPKEALAYSKLSMDDRMIINYNRFFVY